MFKATIRSKDPFSLDEQKRIIERAIVESNKKQKRVYDEAVKERPDLFLGQ